MKIKKIFSVFLLILIILKIWMDWSLYTNFDSVFTSSVIPGWHVTIFPPYFWFGVAIEALLYISLIYFLIKNLSTK